MRNQNLKPGVKSPKNICIIKAQNKRSLCVPERQILCRMYGLENDQAAYEIIKKNESAAAINANYFLINI